MVPLNSLSAIGATALVIVGVLLFVVGAVVLGTTNSNDHRRYSWGVGMLFFGAIVVIVGITFMYLLTRFPCQTFWC